MLMDRLKQQPADKRHLIILDNAEDALTGDAREEVWELIIEVSEPMPRCKTIKLSSVAFAPSRMTHSNTS
jgi:hypothetical protein